MFKPRSFGYMFSIRKSEQVVKEMRLFCHENLKLRKHLCPITIYIDVPNNYQKFHNSFNLFSKMFQYLIFFAYVLWHRQNLCELFHPQYYYKGFV